MGSEVNQVGLGGAHIRAVGATLRLVEEAVGQIEQLLMAPAAGITFRLADDVDAEERHAIQTACERLRGAVGEAHRRLGIDITERSRRRAIRGEVSVLWALLEDTKSAALRGYGALSPEAGAAVDQMLEEISGILIGILRLVAGPAAGTVV